MIKDDAGHLSNVQPHGFTLLCASDLEANSIERNWQVSVDYVDKDKPMDFRTVIQGQWRESSREAVASLRNTVEVAVRTSESQGGQVE